MITHDTSSSPTSAQEDFWRGEFGDAYSKRNRGAKLLASNLVFFSRALKFTHGIRSCIEFGANIGMNLKALALLLPELEQHAIEINPKAAAELREALPAHAVHEGSIVDFQSTRTWDLCLIKGVLIHIAPNQLELAYRSLTEACGRYLLIAEYYNPCPVEIDYRGHSDRLFKRDFAGEILDRYPAFELIDYGFAYRRDPNFPQDDISWFLLEKKR